MTGELLVETNDLSLLYRTRICSYDKDIYTQLTRGEKEHPDWSLGLCVLAVKLGTSFL